MKSIQIVLVLAFVVALWQEMWVIAAICFFLGINATMFTLSNPQQRPASRQNTAVGLALLVVITVAYSLYTGNTTVRQQSSNLEQLRAVVKDMGR